MSKTWIGVIAVAAVVVVGFLFLSGSPDTGPDTAMPETTEPAAEGTADAIEPATEDGAGSDVNVAN